ARDAHEAEFIERQRFRRSFILIERLLQRGKDTFAIATFFHVDEVHNDDAAKVAQTNLPHDFLYGFEVGFDDRVFKPRRAFADKLAGVDINRDQRFGVIDDDVAARLEPHL